MTDTEKKIAEIREALEKATPGPWVYDDLCDDIYEDNTDVIVCNAVGPEDGPLIANAPEWLRFLLEERAKLIKGLRSIRNELDRLSRESRQKWKREGDMYEQGRADAYDEADVLIRDAIKEWTYPEMNKAAQRIEELEAEIERLKVEPQWISIKERLPEEEGEYLVFYKYKGNEDCVDIALFTKRYGWWHEAQITHWQPLPEPPKGE